MPGLGGAPWAAIVSNIGERKGEQMSDKKKGKAAIGRRDFFRKAGAGAVGAAAVGIAAKPSAAEPAKPDKGAAGYRETAHVKKYYELARS